MSERKYPCEAKVIGDPKEYVNELKGLPGKIVTVLTPAKYWGCCCGTRHKIELPDGFPDPPQQCETWMAKTEWLEFI